MKIETKELKLMIFDWQDFYEAFGERHIINTPYYMIREIYWNNIVDNIIRNFNINDWHEYTLTNMVSVYFPKRIATEEELEIRLEQLKNNI